MKIPPTNYQLTWHRPGEIAHHSPGKLERPSTSLSDLLPIKARSTSERETAFRIRSQFISKSRKLVAYIAANPKIAADPKLVSQPVLTSEEKDLSKQANQPAAEDALKNVRLALYNKNYGSFKSTNKFSADRKNSENERINKGIFCNFEDVRDIENKFHQAAIISKNIWESTSINCDGLAYAAMDYVNHKYPTIPVAAVSLSGHTLVALGEITPELANLPLGAWPDHIHVCDPWTNITCHAPDYPKKFIEKMEKWNSGNKLIQANFEWINPISDKWKSCVKEPPEIYVKKQYEKGLFLYHKISPPPVELGA
jgi:hypothetical protein